MAVRGGASYNVILDGKKYVVMSGCKPHDCPAESIAVLYSPRYKEAHTMYSSCGGKAGHEMLTCLNVDEDRMVDERAILYAKIRDSLDHHPD